MLLILLTKNKQTLAVTLLRSMHLAAAAAYKLVSVQLHLFRHTFNLQPNIGLTKTQRIRRSVALPIGQVPRVDVFLITQILLLSIYQAL